MVEDGWQETERQQLRDAQSTTPAQRLAWLEEALVFAWRTGALQRRREQEERELGMQWNDQI